MCCCCSNCKSDPSSDCQCTPCKYPNGILPLIVAQVLMVLAWTFSAYALWDCHFVTVDASKANGILNNIEFISNNNVTIPDYTSATRGLGFFLWEGVDGECKPSDSEYYEDLWELYYDFLGSDWYAPRVLAVLATFVSFCLMVWLFIFSCVSHPKTLRRVVMAICIVLMPIFQAIPFMVLQSDFCSEFDCSMGQSARYGASAVALFACVGFVLYFTKDVLKPTPIGVDQEIPRDPEVQREDPVKEQVMEEQSTDIPFVDVPLADADTTTTKASVY